MSARRGFVYWRLGLLFMLLWSGWLLFADRFRALETSLSAAVAALLSSDVTRVGGTLVLLSPDGDVPMVAVVSRSCSSLPAVLSVLSLAVAVLAGGRARRFGSAFVAIGLVLAVNVLRLAVSMLLGAWFGSVGLVLFHDWVGMLFVFAYTLGAFAVLVALQLRQPSGDLRRYGDAI